MCSADGTSGCSGAQAFDLSTIAEWFQIDKTATNSLIAGQPIEPRWVLPGSARGAIADMERRGGRGRKAARQTRHARPPPGGLLRLALEAAIWEFQPGT